MVDILVLSLSCVLRSLSYNITQVFGFSKCGLKAQVFT